MAVGLRPNPNPNSDRTAIKHTTEYLGTANGAYRVMQIAEKVINLVLNLFKDLSQSTISALKYAGGKLNVAWTMLSIPRIPEATKDAREALSRLFGSGEPGKLRGVRAYASDVNKLGDCAATWGFSTMGLSNNPVVALAVKPVAETADLIANVTDLVPYTDDLVSAYRHRTVAENLATRNLDVEQVLTDTMKYSLLKLIKPIISVATAVFGFLALTYGGPVLPALALITMGLVGSVASLAAHFFKETRPFELIKFAETSTPVVV